MPKKQRKVDITRVEKYWCGKCNRIHRRYRKTDGKKVKIYLDHAKFAQYKTETELWKEDFKKNWRRTVKEQKKTGKAVGTPKKTKRKRSIYSN